MDKYQTLKKIEKEGGVQMQKTEAENLQAMKKTQRKLKEKEHDHLIKSQNFRDHLAEMERGMDTLNKMPKASHYKDEFVFDNAMQELCDNTNYDHHLKDNDLKWYNEAYVKYKSTMR